METLPGLDIVRAAPLVARAKDPEGEAATGARMVLRFSPYGVWYEIRSAWEGHFLERTERGAFAKTFREQAGRIVSQFEHGMDPTIGSKPLGAIADLREDSDSAVAEVDLFEEASYVRDLLPALRAGVLGSSMRMIVTREEWVDSPERSDSNPDGLPERTIKEARLLEVGPVSIGANPDATSGVRSGTDAYFESLRARDPGRFEAIRSRYPSLRTPSARSAEGAAPQDPPAPATDGHPGGMTPAQRRERLYPFLTDKE